MWKSLASQRLTSPVLLSLGLFLLALLPRLPDLGRFLTADEFLWVDRSRNFFAGMTNPAFQCDSVVEKWQFVAHGLACTLRTGHPGVTTMWTGGFGFLLRWLWDGRPGALHDYVVAVSTNPLDASFIAPERLATVLMTSLWVVAVYWLARRLFGPPIALLGAILIALDPFHIALSRVIHHDALSTTFMTLSILCAFIYWGDEPQKRKETEENVTTLQISTSSHQRFPFYQKRWLLLSGLCAGLAFLSKISSLFLMPFIALIGLWFTLKSGGMVPSEGAGKKGGKQYVGLPHLLPLILDGLLWFAAAMALVFMIWPAMWVAPLEALQTVFSLGFKYSTGGHAKGNFLLGQVSQDPGALFYLVTWLYRTTPPVMLGILVALISWLTTRQPGSLANRQLNKAEQMEAEHNPSAFANYLPLMLMLILGYYLLMTLGEKKQERYFLPVYPWLNFIAAAGLMRIWDFYNSRISHLRVKPLLETSRSPQPAARSPHHLRRFLSVLVVLILVINGYLVASSFPYYFTYYNPLLGGIHGAVGAVTIGWGEGLNLAAAYLNQHHNPARTRVASWYESTFAPFYQGNSISYSKEKGKALAGDFVIFYINQTQRRFPDEVMFDYFEKRFKPEKIITLQGLDYAWIYPSLGVDHYLEDQTYTGIASVLAWQWATGDASLTPDRPADFELYWEYLGKQRDESFFFRVVDGQERSWAEGQSQPVASENPPPEQWREGEIIFERGALTLPPGTPPGQYRLQIGFYTRAPAVAEGELLFTLPLTESLITVGHNDELTYTLPASATSINRPLGPALTLLGASLPPRLLADSPLIVPLDLYWRVEQAIPADFELHAGLMDEAGVAQQAWFNLSLAETLNPAETMWQPGDTIHTSWQLSLLPDVPAGTYTFDLVLPAPPESGQPEILSFGSLVIGAEALSKK